MPAASSSRNRRSTGLAAMTALILPWLTSAGECAPVAASANSKRDVLRPDVAPVDPIGGAGAALDPPSDLAFAASAFLGRIALEQDRDFGEIARRPRRSPGEDHVVHAPAAQRLGAGFAHGPADRLEQVGFAAAVRPDDPGQARLDAKFGWLDEALEAAELEPPDLNASCPPLRAASSAGSFLELRLKLLPRRRVRHLAVDEEGRRVVDARVFRRLRDVEQPVELPSDRRGIAAPAPDVTPKRAAICGKPAISRVEPSAARRTCSRSRPFARRSSLRPCQTIGAASHRRPPTSGRIWPAPAQCASRLTEMSGALRRKLRNS